MGYFKMITTSQTWVCPKTANYQVICVAGGYASTTEVKGNNSGGATTSFGNYLSASGGLGGRTFNDAWVAVNGYCLNGNLYGTISCSYGDPNTGFGYGAGGGARAVPHGGNCGSMEMGEFYISEGKSIACTIGKGGEFSDSLSGTITQAMNGTNGVICIREV